MSSSTRSRLPTESSDNSSESTTPPTGRRFTNRYFTPQEKLFAIYRVRNGESKASVSRAMSVPESTLRGWCKNEERILYLSRTRMLDDHEQQNEKSWTVEQTQQQQFFCDNSGALDYRKEVLDSQQIRPVNTTQASLFNFPMVERARMRAYPYPNGKSNSDNVDGILEAQWKNFLRRQLYWKKMNQDFTNVCNGNAQASPTLTTENKENNMILSNYWLNWYRQFYTNMHAQHVFSGVTGPHQLFSRNNLQRIHQENLTESVNGNNNIYNEDAKKYVQVTEDISDDNDQNDTDDSSKGNDGVDPSMALRHGEKFLKWLENCEDPSVTALQIMQLKMLLNKLTVETISEN